MNIPYDRRADVFADWLDAQVTGRSTPDTELEADSELADVCAAADRFHGLDAGLGQFATFVSPTTSRWEDIMMSNSIALGATGQPVDDARERRSIIRFEPRVPGWDRVLSAVLAAAVVLALGAGAWRVFDFGGFGGEKPPSEVSYGGFLPWDDKSQQVLPEVTVPADVEVSSIPYPTATECTVEPLTRDEVVAFLKEVNVSTPAQPERYEQPIRPTNEDKVAMLETYRMQQACWQMPGRYRYVFAFVTPKHFASTMGMNGVGPLSDEDITYWTDMAMAKTRAEEDALSFDYLGGATPVATPEGMASATPRSPSFAPYPDGATPIAIEDLPSTAGWPMIIGDEIMMRGPDLAQATVYMIDPETREVALRGETWEVEFLRVDGVWLLNGTRPTQMG